MSDQLQDLYQAAFNYPAIDNHTHALLREEHRHDVPFESMFEAEGEAAKDSQYSVSALRAVNQLGKVLRLADPTWEDVKKARSALPYDDLCDIFMTPTKITCLLLDDGLGGIAEMAEDWKWHARFGCKTFRIVRLETEAEAVIVDILKAGEILTFEVFTDIFMKRVVASASLDEVVGFKSVACYRTGLAISPTAGSLQEFDQCFTDISKTYSEHGKVRISHKALNDHVVRIGLAVAGKYEKPVQFHTGLGDNDITLALSSPAHMQPIIKAYPQTTFVLLHASYPYTRDAGYLTLVYPNVYLDFGEVFPMVSAQGQRAVVRQMFEVAPTNKILWSTDGHWFPETYYLGTLQARQALFIVLSETVQAGELTEQQAVEIIQNVLFHNSNRVYRLNLQLEQPK